MVVPLILMAEHMDILFFGITRDITGTDQIRLIEEGDRLNTVASLKTYLCQKYPEMAKLSSLAIAVNSAYAQEDTPIDKNDEVAIIPPVSGG